MIDFVRWYFYIGTFSVAMRFLSMLIGYDNEPLQPRTTARRDALGVLLGLPFVLWAAWLLWGSR